MEHGIPSEFFPALILTDNLQIFLDRKVATILAVFSMCWAEKCSVKVKIELFILCELSEKSLIDLLCKIRSQNESIKYILNAEVDL